MRSALLESRFIHPGRSWVRNLLKGLAREGWTVFVSSHLMAEMALTADEVIISAGRRAPPGRVRPSAVQAAPAQQRGDKHSFALSLRATEGP